MKSTVGNDFTLLEQQDMSPADDVWTGFLHENYNFLTNDKGWKEKQESKYMNYGSLPKTLGTEKWWFWTSLCRFKVAALKNEL